MKKLLVLFLTAAMLLGLCACGSSGEGEGTQPPKPEGLQVGYSKISIIPTYEVGLGGYSDAETRTAQGFIDYIYTICVAVTSGDETILIYTIDNCAAPRDVADPIREVVNTATGIAPEKIFIGATHGHNCPSMASYPNATKYREDVANWCAEAGVAALADRAPAQLLSAKAQHEKMNSTRHYIADDGSYVDNSNVGQYDNSRLVGHPMPSDEQMVMLKFDREGDKKDILMVNWQAHPDRASEIGYNQISPSWIGPMRNKLEKDSGMHVAYFTGASGNQIDDSRIASERHGLGWKEYGEALADRAFSMIEKLEPVAGTAVKTKRYIMDVEVDHSWDHMLDQANEVYKLWKTVGKAAGDSLAKTYDMSSSYQARAIRSRAAMDATIPMELNTFCIGDVGFTTGTYEMFSNSGLYVKEHSPFGTTFLITGNSSYMPADICYTYRGYEVDTGYYARGVAEAVAEQYVTMLKELR